MKNLIWAGLSTILFPVLIDDASIAFSNSFLSVLLFAAIFILLRAAGQRPFSLRLKRYTHVLGFLFSLMTAFGFSLGNSGSIAYTDLRLICAILLYTHVYAQLLGLFWLLLEQTESACDLRGIPSANRMAGRLQSGLSALLSRPLLLTLVFLVCWAPCYISTFPGNLVYDASYEYYQLSDGFTKSFPLLHSAIVTRLFSLSERLTGSVNPGIAVYVILQMILCATLFSHILRSFCRASIHPVLLGAMTLYYAAFPVIHLLVTCTTRDVLFSALLTWTVYLFYLLAKDPDAFMSSSRRVILLAAALVFTLLSRNNNSGPLALLLLLALCLFIVFFFGKKHIRHSLLFTGSALSMFYAVTAILTALCQPLYESPPSSSMAILAQPIARAYMMHADSWTEEERAEFESYFNMETLEYFPQNADPSKGNLKVRYANMREFLSFWIHIGLKHPACYLDAVLAGTRQMWFPDCVVDGYTVRGMFPAYEKNYFYFGKYIEEIGSRMNLLPSVFRFYEDVGLRISFEKIPVISMFFSIGFQVWMLLHCIFYAAYRKCRRLFWPLAVLAVYTVCCAFVPLVLLRYFGALFLCAPMVLAFTLQPAHALKQPAANR